MNRQEKIKFQGPRSPLAIEFDGTGTAIYIRVSTQAVSDTRDLGDGVLADCDAKGALVGFEIVGLSRSRVGRVFASLRAKYECEAPNLAQLAIIEA